MKDKDLTNLEVILIVAIVALGAYVCGQPEVKIDPPLAIDSVAAMYQPMDSAAVEEFIARRDSLR